MPAVCERESKKEYAKIKLQMHIYFAQIYSLIPSTLGVLRMIKRCHQTMHFVKAPIFPEGAALMRKWRRMLRTILQGRRPSEINFWGRIIMN